MKGYFGNSDQRTDKQRAIDEAEDALHTRVYKSIETQNTALAAFYVWWKGDEHRALCTLHQAVITYTRSFPGRTITLISELIITHANDYTS